MENEIIANKLQDKNVLLICQKFFSYHNDIINALKKMGANVDFFDERPSNNAVTKAILRINKAFLASKIRRYYKSILKDIQSNEYDYILIIKPEGIPKSVISILRKLNPKAKVVIMLWDAIANNTAAGEKLKLADETFSFDPKDCEKYNMKFRPLFYNEKYSDIAKTNTKAQIDLLFVGTVHSDRYMLLKNIEKKFIKKGYKVYYYMYLPSKILYYIKKVVLKQFRGSNIKEFKFKSISQDEVLSLLSKSNAVIDIQHPNQIGLTMRTIEMLGANKKIITTNSSVKKYDFYDNRNIQVVGRDMKGIDMEFFKTDYVRVPNNIKQRYSIESWLLELLDS